MNKEKIVAVLRELNNISGFRISLHNTSFEEIAAYPEQKQRFCSYIQEHSERELNACIECDRQAAKRVLESERTLIYRCRHGLIEAISPLYNFGALTGFLMMGQVRPAKEGINRLLLALSRLGKRDFEANEIAAAVPTVNDDMVRSFVSIMTICAQYLTLSNSVTGAKPTVGELAMRYIGNNYTRKITVKDICDAVGYSKSTVLSSFKKEYHTTVGSYLTAMRLERAKKMLEQQEYSISDVSAACGFSDQSYFSKVFSAKYGQTPSDYRKDERK